MEKLIKTKASGPSGREVPCGAATEGAVLWRSIERFVRSFDHRISPNRPFEFGPRDQTKQKTISKSINRKSHMYIYIYIYIYTHTFLYQLVNIYT